MLSVDIEAVLNAGHCVEPDNETQLCAIAPGVTARTDNSAVLLLKPVDRCFRSLEQFGFAPSSIIVPRLDSTDSIVSKESALCDDECCIVLSWPFSEFSSLIFRSAGLPHSSTRSNSTFVVLIFSTSGGGVNNKKKMPASDAILH